MKNIVILSSELWGKMMLSKMHFAVEMSKQGNNVYFVNPPRPEKIDGYATILEKNGNITVIQLKQIKARLFLRYKAYWLYKIVTNRYVRAIQNIAGNIDEVWCFDPNTYCDLRKFKAPFTRLLLYDFYKGDNVVKLANTAQGLVSVSKVILDHYENVAIPKLLVQHGLSENFSKKAEQVLQNKTDIRHNPIKIGYVGNLFRQGVNTSLAKTIIENHPKIEFHFWGPNSLQNSNLSTVYDIKYKESEEFMEFLKTAKNVFFHGMKSQEELSEALFQMDAFLFLYSYTKDVNQASNAHKLMEYLSTGKTVIATYVSNYDGSGLLEMSDKNEEEKLIGIFDEVISNLEKYNSESMQKERIEFALNNTYAKQIDRIRTQVI